jgi:hypothetical protein
MGSGVTSMIGESTSSLPQAVKIPIAIIIAASNFFFMKNLSSLFFIFLLFYPESRSLSILSGIFPIENFGGYIGTAYEKQKRSFRDA